MPSPPRAHPAPPAALSNAVAQHSQRMGPLQHLSRGVARICQITEHCAFRSPIEIGDSNALCHGCKASQVVGVATGNDRTSAQVRVGHEEGIDRHLRPSADRSEQLPGSHAHATVDRMDLDPLTSQTGEHTGISRSTADHLGEDSRDRCDRQVPRSHLHHERSDPIPAEGRPVGNRRDGLAVEQEHSTGLRWSVTGGCPVVHDARGPLERLRVDRAMRGLELGEPPVDSSEVPEPGQIRTHRLVDRRRQTPRIDERPELFELLGVERERHLLLRHGRMVVRSHVYCERPPGYDGRRDRQRSRPTPRRPPRRPGHGPGSG